MNNPNPTRPTLKLKVAPRRPITAAASTAAASTAAASGAAASGAPASNPAATRAPPPGKAKPGAHWSDEYKQRMQADMDALVR